MVSGTLKISEKEKDKEIMQYPKSVAFIISNEFCERFNYYGMRTILVLYLTSKLCYDDDTATVLFHVFTMLVYLCPLVGAIIADSWLGKFKTILYLSIVYAVGGVIVALGAIPPLQLPVKEATIIGLVLIAIGTGGIKPCVSAFGGDQFRLPEQAKQLATFFSLFYFAINAGSTISTSITPFLREDVHCFGDKDCFSLAFGVPAILMLMSVVIFVAGKKLYVMKPPAGNMIFNVSNCISEAISGWSRQRKTNPRKHWLDYAEPVCGQKLVSDTKTLMKILILYLPFPVFWALFDQQGSRWTFQATRMNGDVFGYVIKPDHMQVFNPLLILGFIPLFDYVLYPILAKLGIKRPLQKLTMGGLLAAIAFVLSALVELKLAAVEPPPIGEMEAQFRLYNNMPCTYRLTTDLPIDVMKTPILLEPTDMLEESGLVVPQDVAYHYEAQSAHGRCPDLSGEFKLKPGQAISYFLSGDKMFTLDEVTEKSKLGNPLVRVLFNVPLNAKDSATIVDPAEVVTELQPDDMHQVVTVVRGTSSIRINDKEVATIDTKVGGVYTLLISGDDTEGYKFQSHIVLPPNTVHMMWQLPQIIVITAAEIMFSVTGLEFSFTQAPQSMKSVLQACWLLSVAIGNMLVVVIAELKFFKSQAAEFALFAGLMVVDIFVFMMLAVRYKYVEHNDDPEMGEEPQTPKRTPKTPRSKTNSLSKGSTSERTQTSLEGRSNEGFVDEH